MIARHRNRRHQRGISYVEVLIAVVIVAATVVPATTAIRGAMDTASADVESTAIHYRMFGRLEEVLAEPFSVVSQQSADESTPSAYSDSAGTTDRRLVYISHYDGDNADSDNDPFTGADADLLWIRVEIEGTAGFLQALKTM